MPIPQKHFNVTKSLAFMKNLIRNTHLLDEHLSNMTEMPFQIILINESQQPSGGNIISKTNEIKIGI